MNRQAKTKYNESVWSKEEFKNSSWEWGWNRKSVPSNAVWQLGCLPSDDKWWSRRTDFSSPSLILYLAHHLILFFFIKRKKKHVLGSKPLIWCSMVMHSSAIESSIFWNIVRDLTVMCIEGLIESMVNVLSIELRVLSILEKRHCVLAGIYQNSPILAKIVLIAIA